MDYPPIYWLLPAFLFSEWSLDWIADNAPCWLGGHCP